MKIIENKKLFGKINIIDIIIILVVLIVGIVVYSIVFKEEATNGIGAEYFKTTCVAKIENMPVGSSKFLKVGADVYDNTTNTYIGKLKEVTSGEYIRIEENYETNTLVESKVPNKENVDATIEINVADQGADLVTDSNYFIKVGKDFHLRCANFGGYGYMISIDRGDK